MGSLTTWTSILGLIGSLIWWVHLLHLARHRRELVMLADLPGTTPADGWPSLAVLLAARDEAKSVEKAVRSMLKDDYPDLEVIAVDDRSTDGTSVILDQVAEEESRLQVIHLTDLPPAWLGKTHALQVASEATSAEWMLFTDADVILAPGSLRRAVAFAEAERLDHVTVSPEVPTESIGERMFLALFELLLSIHSPIGRVISPRSRAYLGIGAFNLVRAESFRAIGGFRHLALSVDDDMRLAKVLKFAGYKMRLLLGRNSVSVRWQVGLRGMIGGLEKNFFASQGFDLGRVIVVAWGSQHSAFSLF